MELIKQYDEVIYMAQKKWTSQSEKYSTAFCEYYLPKVVYDPNFNP